MPELEIVNDGSIYGQRSSMKKQYLNPPNGDSIGSRRSSVALPNSNPNEEINLENTPTPTEDVTKRKKSSRSGIFELAQMRETGKNLRDVNEPQGAGDKQADPTERVSTRATWAKTKSRRTESPPKENGPSEHCLTNPLAREAKGKPNLSAEIRSCSAENSEPEPGRATWRKSKREDLTKADTSHIELFTGKSTKTSPVTMQSPAVVLKDIKLPQGRITRSITRRMREESKKAEEISVPVSSSPIKAGPSGPEYNIAIRARRSSFSRTRTDEGLEGQ
ncbi:uncharacterized protein PV09_09748 [Verruconis gallopava]|uniref:Uncharacterized protein n=1 Tax=Verruconis gallopava TaxID=253628 RepID=A0A0D2AHP2_9PEZI|nr:uncharacterized protein PV09_09748 [Verruconis gallopava]KIV98433.1 hypothetical protein PV09_09748 [Verruconis gallopava]